MDAICTWSRAFQVPREPQKTVAKLTGSSMASTFEELDQLAALMRKRSQLSQNRREDRRPGTAGPGRSPAGGAEILTLE